MVFIPFPGGSVVDDEFPPLSGVGEVEIQRNLTHWFIMTDSVPVVLVPRTQERTPSGATRTVDGTPRALQRFKFVYGGNTGAGRAGIVPTGDGRERMFSYVLIGDFDAQVEPGDHWTDTEDQAWEVEEILPDNGYERKATIRSYGSKPQYG